MCIAGCCQHFGFKETAIQQDAIIHASLLAPPCSNWISLSCGNLWTRRQMQSMWLAKGTHWTCLVNRWQTLIRLSRKQQLPLLHVMARRHRAILRQMGIYDWKIYSNSKPTTMALPSMPVEHITKSLYMVYSSALNGYSPCPALNVLPYGWESDDTNRQLILRNMTDVVSYAPEHILKLVRSLHGAPAGLHNVVWLWWLYLCKSNQS